MTPDEQVKLLKLAWDTIGTEFAPRHLQYEISYNGATFAVHGNASRTYEWKSGNDLLDGFLTGYEGPAP